MNEARPFASLSSGLLARKGTAKPAMRPQGYHNGHGFEDLGWNDMGHDPVEDAEADDLPEHVPSSIAALTPAPKLPRQDEEPEVIAQQRAIAETFEPEIAESFGPEAVEAEEAGTVEEIAEIEAPAPAPVPVPVRIKAPAEIVPLPKRRSSAASQGRKAAFTLRLDGERHLRLRLATAVTGRSAQHLVQSALDELLATLPEIEALAERVPAAKAKGR